MFTGLIEEIGEVQALVDLGDSKRITLQASKVLEGTELGDSIQVSGVCLTVTEKTGNTFTADVMQQTLKMSTLGGLREGDAVNLERATRADTRLGGHLVQGHVDGVATVTRVQPNDNWRVLRFAIDTEISMMLVAQGSITVAGVSLTVSDLSGAQEENQWFEVSLIPETLAATTLGKLRVGDLVNIETDILARHISRMLAFKDSPSKGN